MSRSTRRTARRCACRRARLRRGQTLIIFALSFTVLLGLAGLSIDVARVYGIYGRMQRAAEAGVLAAVLYMPNNYNTNYSDGNNAIKRALQETVKNGFGVGELVYLPASPSSTYFGCPTPPSSFEVAVCPVANHLSDLQVTVTQTVSLVLLSGLGVSPITLRASAQAEYMPPIQIGSRSSYFGDQVECSPGNVKNTSASYCAASGANANRLQYFFAAFNGPADIKETGDPFVYCEEGPGYLPGPSLDPDNGDSLRTYNNYGTDHPQQTGVTVGSSIASYCGKPVPGGNSGNPDYQPDGYDGPATFGSAHAGGYNYAINVTNTVSAASVWVYNPNYMPGVTGTPDHFQDNGAASYYRGPHGEGITTFDGTHYDAPLFYFDTTFSIYQVASYFDRSSDGGGSGTYPNNALFTQTYHPYDAVPADLTAHGCASGTVYDPLWNGADTTNWYHNRALLSTVQGKGCVAPPACSLAVALSNWCKLGVKLSGPGVYRMVVEATELSATALNALDPRGYDYSSTQTDGYGSHEYSIALCDTQNPTGPYGSQGCADGSSGGALPDVQVYGWNNMDIIFEQQLSTATPNKSNPLTSCVTKATVRYTCVDLGCIPTEYAGRSVTVRIYDVGDGSGDMYVGVVPPDPTTAQVIYPSYSNGVTANIDGDPVVQARFASTASSPGGYRALNGLWLDVLLKLSSTYKGDCATTQTSAQTGKSGWWQLVYASNNGNPSDKFAVTFTLVGSPVHLAPVALG